MLLFQVRRRPGDYRAGREKTIFYSNLESDASPQRWGFNDQGQIHIRHSWRDEESNADQAGLPLAATREALELSRRTLYLRQVPRCCRRKLPHCNPPLEPVPPARRLDRHVVADHLGGAGRPVPARLDGRRNSSVWSRQGAMARKAIGGRAANAQHAGRLSGSGVCVRPANEPHRICPVYWSAFPTVTGGRRIRRQVDNQRCALDGPRRFRLPGAALRRLRGSRLAHEASASTAMPRHATRVADAMPELRMRRYMRCPFDVLVADPSLLTSAAGYNDCVTIRYYRPAAARSAGRPCPHSPM